MNFFDFDFDLEWREIFRFSVVLFVSDMDERTKKNKGLEKSWKGLLSHGDLDKFKMSFTNFLDDTWMVGS